MKTRLCHWGERNCDSASELSFECLLDLQTSLHPSDLSAKRGHSQRWYLRALWQTTDKTALWKSGVISCGRWAWHLALKPAAFDPQFVLKLEKTHVPTCKCGLSPEHRSSDNTRPARLLGRAGPLLPTPDWAAGVSQGPHAPLCYSSSLLPLPFIITCLPCIIAAPGPWQIQARCSRPFRVLSWLL